MSYGAVTKPLKSLDPFVCMVSLINNAVKSSLSAFLIFSLANDSTCCCRHSMLDTVKPEYIEKQG